eukprot:14610266-Heterocapsa_arctica.AAC.1
MKAALDCSDSSAAACAVTSSSLEGGLGPWRGGEHGFDALEDLDSEPLREVRLRNAWESGRDGQSEGAIYLSNSPR